MSVARNVIVVAGLLALAGCGASSKAGPPMTHRGVTLTYKVTPVVTRATDPEVLNRAAQVMRGRLAALGVKQATVTRAGDTFRVSVPATSKAAVSDLVGRPGRLVFYDWEPNVIGPGGRPAPDDPSVTGGASAGIQGAGSMSRYAAVLRAAKRPRTRGSLPGDQFYFVDASRKRVLAGPADTGARLLGTLHGPRPARSRVVVVKRGTAIVHAETSPQTQRVDQWYVLNDKPALTGADITKPEGVLDPSSKQPIVAFDFTARGKKLWEDVTRQIAKRGQAAQLPGTPSLSAAQHFAIALDDELVSVPFIDFKHNPDGIDASNGSQIEGGFTRRSAQHLAALLQAGALPVSVELVSTRPTRLP